MGAPACYVRTFRGSTPSLAGHLRRRCDPHHIFRFGHLTCGNAAQSGVGGPLGGRFSTGRACVHNLWTKLWTAGGPAAGLPPHERWIGRPCVDNSDGAAGNTPTASDLTEVWHTLVGDLQPNQRAWLRSSEPVTLHEHTAIIAVPDDFTRQQLEGRLRTRLEDSLTHAFGQQIRIAVTVDPQLDDGMGLEDLEPEPPSTGDRARPTSRDNTDLSTCRLRWHRPPRPTLRAPWRPGSTRSTSSRRFVIGSSNRFAHAAAVAVAEAPGKAYNPLLVYGDSGLGKTHLLHAIGHYVRSLFAGPRCATSPARSSPTSSSTRSKDKRPETFQRRYREVDVLLIDDIQFLEGKTQTQEEFFHTFNTLHNANKQIVLTSDRAPKRLDAARGPAAQPLRVGPDHRRAAARPRDPHRDPAQEGGDRADDRAARGARVHRQQDPDQHPRARGCADPGHGVRQPQPPGGRPDPGRDRPQGPDPRGRRARDHRGR